MKIFLDSANLAEIQYWNELGVISGVTTNIKLLSEQNVADYRDHLTKIANIVNHPVSFELQEDDYNNMINMAVEISNWHRMMVVKVPMWPSGIGLKLLRDLKDLNVRTNTTWVTSITQAVMALHAGTNYISYFWSRANKNGINAFSDVQSLHYFLKDKFYKCLIIGASIHNEEEFKNAFKAGADIVTVSGKVLQEILNNKATLLIQKEREEYY